MALTQRVLSGSRTKGSTASPSGSIIYSYQGIYANTDAAYFGSLLPRIGSGARTKLYKGAKPLSEKEFDDSLVINNDTSDMRGISGSVVSTRIGFDLERMTFGQAPTTQRGEPFADISGFDPVSYLQDPGHTMWPANLWNAGILPDHEFDGVIEPFDIRREILGQVNLRHEGHGPRGAVVGSFSETPFGSTEITDTWFKSDPPLTPFFDGPNEMSAWHARDVPVLGRMTFTALSASWTDPNSAQPLQPYQGLEREDTGPYITTDVHEIIYSKIYAQQPDTPLPLNSYDLNERWSSTPATEYTSADALVGWWRCTRSELSDAKLGTEGDVEFPPLLNMTVYSIPNSAANAKSGELKSFPTSNCIISDRVPSNIDVGSYIDSPGINIQTGAGMMEAPTDASADGMEFYGVNTGSLDATLGGSYAANTLKPFTFALWVNMSTSTYPLPTFQVLQAWAQPEVGKNPIRMFRLGFEGGTEDGDNYWRMTASRRASHATNTASGNPVVPEDLANLCKSTNINAPEGKYPDGTKWAHFAWVFSGVYDGTTPPFRFFCNGNEVSDEAVYENASQPIEFPDSTQQCAARLAVSLEYEVGGNSVVVTGGSMTTGQYICDLALWDEALHYTQIRYVYQVNSGGALRSERVSQPGSIVNALKLLNSASCGSLTNPEEETANHGFYFDKKAGSIVYGDW